ncbi:hypothetical protein EV142_10657 [Flavobacterium circumlabens]|uniref:Uncharacterized protein n=1 Tax=Flavobacterium circumlabens TaxID=2133765 RepID=A0ABY2AW64_9FLAO|nr:hypothetical protein EV142_10657 [Flavobacterium circumlabens]
MPSDFQSNTGVDDADAQSYRYTNELDFFIIVNTDTENYL